ncbi:MAG: restriction endonuclease subunit S [Lactobacillus crispatus]
MPDNWTYKKLIDVAETTTGYSYKGKELIDSNNIGLATIKNFVKTGGFQSKGYKSIIPSKSVKQNQYASLFDILVAHTDLTQNADIIGNAEPVLTTKNFKKIIYSMDLVKVVPKQNKISKWLLDLILLSKRVKNHCLSYVNGTTVLHLSKKALKELEIPLPNDPDKLSNVTKIAKNYLLMMSRNIQENEKLIELKQQLINKYF